MHLERRNHYNYLIVVVFSVIKPMVLLVMISVAESALDVLVFGAFLYTRRVCSTAGALLQIGISQTLIKNLAVHKEKASQSLTFVFVGLVLLIISSLLLLFFAVGNMNFLTKYIFSESNVYNYYTIKWLLLLVVAFAVSYITNAILIAERRVISYNIIHILNHGFILLIFILYLGKVDFVDLVKLQVFSLSVISILTLVYFFGKNNACLTISKKVMRQVGGEFYSYGLSRGVISFFDMFVFMLAPWLLRDDVISAGYMIISLTLIKLVQALVLPISQLSGVSILRDASDINDREASLVTFVNFLVLCSLLFSLLLLVFLFFWVDDIILLWLGSGEAHEGVTSQVEILMWSVVPYSIYLILYSVIEMNWVRNWNFYNLTVAIVIMVCGYELMLLFGVEQVRAVSIAFVLSLYNMGLMSLLVVRKQLVSFDRYIFYRSLGGVLVLSFICAYLKFNGVIFGMYLSLLFILLISVFFIYINRRKIVR